MIAPDTSVIVAAFASWHELHEAADRAVRQGTRLIGHCAVETYSVLTRLPPPHRAPASLVRQFLEARFGDDWLVLDASGLAGILFRLPDLMISGGATYDALVAATAAQAGATLISIDRRAASTYQRCGVEHRLLDT